MQVSLGLPVGVNVFFCLWVLAPPWRTDSLSRVHPASDPLHTGGGLQLLQNLELDKSVYNFQLKASSQRLHLPFYKVSDFFLQTAGGLLALNVIVRASTRGNSNFLKWSAKTPESWTFNGDTKRCKMHVRNASTVADCHFNRELNIWMATWAAELHDTSRFLRAWSVVALVAATLSAQTRDTVDPNNTF